jgi:predicted cation transporter
MNTIVGVALVVLLLLGPILSRLVEEQIEAFFLAIGLLAMTLAGAWQWDVARHAAEEPVWITLAVIVAGVVFDHVRGLMDHAIARMRVRIAGRLLCAGAVFLIALLSSLITAIVAALVLVEIVGLLRLESSARLRVTVAGCFAIGLGASLTPLGEPLSTLAADALGLDFTGLFRLLAPYVLPGMLACSIVAGLFAALVLVSHAFSDLALRYVPLLSSEQLFWANTVSAVMDNATLVALEVHSMDPARAREAIIALLVAGGMLVPGNIPNIVAAAALRIRASGWAKIGLPMGLVLLGIYFALLEVAG